jgi:hypothetical protein
LQEVRVRKATRISVPTKNDLFFITKTVYSDYLKSLL